MRAGGVSKAASFGEKRKRADRSVYVGDDLFVLLQEDPNKTWKVILVSASGNNKIKLISCCRERKHYRNLKTREGCVTCSKTRIILGLVNRVTRLVLTKIVL